MPIIQSERGVSSVKGIPLRWGVKAYRELRAARGNPLEAVPARYIELCSMLDSVIEADIPLDTTDANIIIFANKIAARCADNRDSLVKVRRILAECGIEEPNYGRNEPSGFILRASDPAWVRRQVRKIHGRQFEHAAIRLGMVSFRAGAYASNETVQRRMAQNARNKKILAATQMDNGRGQTFSLADLAAKGTANKAIRRGELMLRMRGMEEIATEMGHVGVFVTLTCPSKYHAILSRSGTTNPAYNNSTPKEAQEYLQNAWERIRAKNGRNGVRPYGFRIAEPHHDGCPHWHMLLFVAPEQVEKCTAIMTEYALAEDGDEPGAKKNRIKIVRIDVNKGSAAGYIAKYVGKNIDDEHVESHVDEDGSIIETDLIGDQVIKPSQRVEAWAAQWGIRQFQSIGAPPITVWRELRRIEEETMRRAPKHLRDAWNAAQNIDGQKPADFAAYIRAQGGVNTGCNYKIAIAKRVEEVEGRYGFEEQARPVGIYCRANPSGVYESVRYQWSRVDGVAVAVDVPWTGVNNCTKSSTPAWFPDAKQSEEVTDYDPAEWFDSIEAEQIIFYPHEVEQMVAEAEVMAVMHRSCTVFTAQNTRKNRVQIAKKPELFFNQGWKQ